MSYLRLPTTPRALPTDDDSPDQEKEKEMKVKDWTNIDSNPSSNDPNPNVVTLVGEDAAVFNLSEQTTERWLKFVAVLTVVMVILYLVWINPGQGLADDYVHLFTDAFEDPTVCMLAIFTAFAVFHSGGAGLRPYAEPIVGERVYRVFFAGVSLPLAVVTLVYFINHRYSGIPLWDLRGVPHVHDFVWGLSLVSFLLLYPSTFNLLEIAAVDKPKLHLYETGVMRITRHPQAWGQLLWCVAHTLWIGNSFMVATSCALMAHHLFGCWHGDRRLEAKHGDAFLAVKARTSIVPFAAILDGRQVLPSDYYKEWLRWPYAAVVAFTVGAYFAHPLMQQGSYFLGW